MHGRRLPRSLRISASEMAKKGAAAPLWRPKTSTFLLHASCRKIGLKAALVEDGPVFRGQLSTIVDNCQCPATHPGMSLIQFGTMAGVVMTRGGWAKQLDLL